MTPKTTWWKTAAGLAATAVMLFPVYWMINVSFTADQRMRKSPPDWFPVGGTLDGYRSVLDQQLPYLGTSLIVGLGTVALTLAIAAPAGFALAKLRPRGGGVLSFLLLVAQMIPGIIMAMGYYAFLLNIGMLNTLTGLIIADTTIAVPFAVLIFTAFMSGIPHEVMHAAVVDGAGPARTFWSVVMPVSRNATVTVSLFAFLWAWSDFVFASTLDSGGPLRPITLGIYHYIGNNNQEWNAIMATAVVASIPRPSCSSSPSATSPPASPQEQSRTDPPPYSRARRRAPAALTPAFAPPPTVGRTNTPHAERGHTMTVAPQGPEFSLREIPFSHSGSWFNFSPVIAEKIYADDVHLVSHQNGLHPILRLVPVAGDRHQRRHTTVTGTPAQLTWHHPHGAIALAYDSADTVRITGIGLNLLVAAASPSLTPFSGPYFYPDPVDGSHVYTVYETGRRYRITVLAGRLAEVTGGQSLGLAERGVVCTGDDLPWEIAIEEYETARAPYRPERSFAEVHKSAQAAYGAFVDAVAPWRDAETPAAELAAYVLWSATVRPAGFLARPAVLMSKHWMNKIWSWDHCFNALALASGQPDLAWDQFQTPFDHQDAAGALPDSVTHSEILYNFVKPPIHGWALHRLRRHLHLNPDDLLQVYGSLADWTRFWLEHRRTHNSPLAHYQHGNDSGWDNATCFDPERVIESADLAAFLVLQLRELADLATELGLDSDAADWRRKAQQMQADMIENLWTGQRFRARSALSGQTWTSDSLLDLMPIILGAELDPAIAEALAQRISAHLTPYGLATELPTSAHYTADGYWRGPIWAPVTVLIEDGLRRAGHTGLADHISNTFRALCEKSGFAENFDALTGSGLRDRAYTWTASAYLVLSAAHQQRHSHH